MRKSSRACLIAGIVLFGMAAFVFLPCGAGLGALPREMGFWGGLHNSLYHLDQAKSTWAEEKHKSEGDVPTMSELAPYLGEWTNSIQHFAECGVEFKITPFSETERQTDIATLNRNVSFQRGFCRFYRAGTSYSLHTGTKTVQSYSKSQLVLAYYHHFRPLIAGALLVSGIASMLVVAIQIARSSTVTNGAHEHRIA